MTLFNSGCRTSNFLKLSSIGEGPLPSPRVSLDLIVSQFLHVEGFAVKLLTCL